MEIKNYRECAANGKDIAIFDIWLPSFGATLRNYRIVRKKTGGWFVSAPSFCEANADGTKTWIPYLDFSEVRKKDFYDKLMHMLKDVVRH